MQKTGVRRFWGLLLSLVESVLRRPTRSVRLICRLILKAMRRVLRVQRLMRPVLRKPPLQLIKTDWEAAHTDRMGEWLIDRQA